MPASIFVTGSGIITGIGNGKENTLESLKKGISGVSFIKYLKNTQHTNIPVCEVKMTDEEMKNLLHIPKDTIMARTALMGIIAMNEAIKEAKFSEMKPKRIAFISGTTVGGMEKSEQFYMDFMDSENNDSNEYIGTHDCATCTNMIADYYGDFDLVTTISTACSSAANAIILGAELIKTGRVDAAVVGGAECITKYHLNGFNTLKILDNEMCKPFDQNRAGLNLGEGAAYLVLESEESVKKRNADVLCCLSGYANTCDAYHQTASSPDGEGAFLAMKKSIENANLTPEDIDYINAHGTGTLNNDTSEGTAIMRIFGDHIPPVSSTKSFTGHTTSAAGSVEAVISILALLNNFIPQNLNFTTQIDTLSFSPVTQNITDRILHNVLSNSFGFGGNDSACIFSKINSQQ